MRSLPATTWPILIGVAVMLSIAMGLRQSLGIFMTPAVQDLGIAISQFTLAIAIQNLIWGFAQPFTGAFAQKWGFRPVMTAGAVLYVAGMAIFMVSGGMLGVMLGAGILVGVALACTASAMGMAVASRAVPAHVRSTVLGVVSAFGSLGSAFSAPIGQLLMEAWDWRAGVAGFVVLAALMVPAAWIGGRADRIPLQRVAGEAGSAMDAFHVAMRNPAFMIMTGAYFICGLQLVFLTTHLPSYLQLCGMDPMLSAKALAVIGAFNVLGSLFFGWAGGRWSKPALLGGIYLTRSVVLGWYFYTPPTPESTLVFAAIMGFLWLGVAPLVAGIVAELFGLRWQAMIQGLAFTSHQLGSFVGAFGGGLLFDALGSYDLAWKLGVGMGIVAGTVQILGALPRWPGAPRPATG